jgi:hypothetical protein
MRYLRYELARGYRLTYPAPCDPIRAMARVILFAIRRSI